MSHRPGTRLARVLLLGLAAVLVPTACAPANAPGGDPAPSTVQAPAADPAPGASDKDAGKSAASPNAARADAEPAGVDPAPGETTLSKIERTDEEWRKLLTPEEYYILREKGTERAGTGEYTHTKTKGVYHCKGCGLPLFESDTKFESGCGWPSFFKPLKGVNLTETKDTSFGMVRTEITCSRCGGHMGHVFNDGPAPTGLRYCINSASIKLVPADEDGKPGTEEPGAE